MKRASISQSDPSRLWFPFREIGWSDTVRGDEHISPAAYRYPFSAVTHNDGLLVVDKCLPKNRISFIGPSGHFVWSFEKKPRMNGAASLPNGDIAVIFNRSILRLSNNGRQLSSVNLPGTEPFDCVAAAGDTLIVGSDEGVLVLTLTGTVLSQYSCESLGLESVTDIFPTADGGMLVTDSWSSAVKEFDSSGHLRRTIQPESYHGDVSGRCVGPRSSCALPDGRVIVADTLNRRLVEFADDSGVGTEIALREEFHWISPTFVRPGKQAGLIVVDTGRQCVVEVDRGTVRKATGRVQQRSSFLAFPRSAEVDGQGHLFVADTHHDRIARFSLSEPCSPPIDFSRVLEGEIRLPRSATCGPEGSVVIADGLNGRIVVLNARGNVVREVSRVRAKNEFYRLVDPHHAQLCANSLLTITDSESATVWVIDDDDRVIARLPPKASSPFRDPHSAHLTLDGIVWVADSGNDRVRRFRISSGVPPLEMFQSADELGTLTYPRYVLPYTRHGALIPDTDAGRIVFFSGGQIDQSIGPLLDRPSCSLISNEIRTPRWVAVGSQNDIFITDFWNHRVLQMRRGNFM